MLKNGLCCVLLSVKQSDIVLSDGLGYYSLKTSINDSLPRRAVSRAELARQGNMAFLEY